MGLAPPPPCPGRVPPLVAPRLLHVNGAFSLPTPGVVHPLSPCRRLPPADPPGGALPFTGTGSVPLAAGSGGRPVLARASPPPPPGHGRVTPSDPLLFQVAALLSSRLLQTHSVRLLLSPYPPPRPCSTLHSIFAFFSYCFVFLAISGTTQNFWCHFCHLLLDT